MRAQGHGGPRIEVRSGGYSARNSGSLRPSEERRRNRSAHAEAQPEASIKRIGIYSHKGASAGIQSELNICYYLTLGI